MAAPHFTASKADVRAASLVARQACDPGWGAALPQHAQAWPAPGAAVAAFWPIGSEIDTRPLLHAWHDRGCGVLLPRAGVRGNPLTFHRWQPGAVMLPNRFGTVVPDGPDIRPDFVLVPLLAYDGAGRRLGYGAGYYDITLAGLPDVPRMGCAFSAQRVAYVPVEAHDIPLPAVLTERGIERFEGQ